MPGITAALARGDEENTKTLCLEKGASGTFCKVKSVQVINVYVQ
jgi:hypothetical protein